MMIRSEGLQSAHAPVEVAQARRDARQMPVAHEGRVGHVDGGLDGIGKTLETAVVASGFGQFEQPPLGILDLLGRRHVDRRIIGDVDHVLADRDQRPARRQIVDRAPVICGIDDGDRLGGKPRQILRNRHLADLFVGRQEGLDRHRIGGLAHAHEFAGDLIDLAVDRLVEMRRLQEIRDAVIGVVIDENRAKQRLLGLDIVGRLAVKRRLRARQFADCFGHSDPFSMSVARTKQNVKARLSNRLCPNPLAIARNS